MDENPYQSPRAEQETSSPPPGWRVAATAEMVVSLLLILITLAAVGIAIFSHPMPARE